MYKSAKQIAGNKTKRLLLTQHSVLSRTLPNLLNVVYMLSAVSGE